MSRPRRRSHPHDPSPFDAALEGADSPYGMPAHLNRLDPTREASTATSMHIDHPLLGRLLHEDTERYAALREYAEPAGLSYEDVLSELEPHLNSGALATEVAGDEVFLHTGPSGRPAPPHLPACPPNLWERLRQRQHPEDAYDVWMRIRVMERAGWRVVSQPERFIPALRTIDLHPTVGIEFGDVILPLLYGKGAEPDLLVRPDGPLALLERCDAIGVAVACPSGELDPAITAVRRWRGTHPRPPRILIVALEEPSYLPVLLTNTDAVVAPHSATRQHLDGHTPPTAQGG